MGTPLPGRGDTGGAAIYDDGVTRIWTVVKNGHIRRFSFGIALENSTRNTVRSVNTWDNIVGIVIGNTSLVKDCTVQRNLSHGIVTGDSGQVEDCYVGGTGGSDANGGYVVIGGQRMLATRNWVNGNGFSGIVGGGRRAFTRQLRYSASATTTSGHRRHPGRVPVDDRVQHARPQWGREHPYHRRWLRREEQQVSFARFASGDSSRTWLVMAGVDLRTVQEMGGWRSLAMVRKHAHLAPAHRLAAVEALVRAPELDRNLTEAPSAHQPARAK